MPPSVDFTAPATPSDFCLPSPLPVQALPGSAVQAIGAAALRYLVKFSVVPDSSERKKTLIGSLGRVTPELSLAIDASFHVVTLPVKMLAATSGVRTSLPTPLTLYEIAIGPVTIGRFQAGEPQYFAAASASMVPSFTTVLSAESEPAKSTWPAMNCLMPAPEPVGL